MVNRESKSAAPPAEGPFARKPTTPPPETPPFHRRARPDTTAAPIARRNGAAISALLFPAAAVGAACGGIEGFVERLPDLIFIGGFMLTIAAASRRNAMTLPVVLASMLIWPVVFAYVLVKRN